jgi:AraC family transcriptional activator of pobA
MKKDSTSPHVFHSISELHRALGLPKPVHPLISLVNYSEVTMEAMDAGHAMLLNFYKISFKTNFRGQIKYGQQYYDFEEGGLSFFAPGQVITVTEADGDYTGYTLLVHPDFLLHHPLGTAIRQYGFFAYAANEALCLSDQERATIVAIFATLEQELTHAIDSFSQTILLSQIEQLLNYSHRYYARQFITRRAVYHDVVARVEELLLQYFATGQPLVSGLPTVQYLAEQLHQSPRYLSDLLRQHTGQNAQQHIHDHLLAKAKELLSTQHLSVAEVAYQLGFEHAQSFSKLFKRKTQSTPVEFQQSLN